MESPYYEMTHDFEEENRLFQSGYVKGYYDAVMKCPDIVRCKDCAYALFKEGLVRHGHIFCTKPFTERWQAVKPDDWFCADGARKE